MAVEYIEKKQEDRGDPVVIPDDADHKKQVFKFIDNYYRGAPGCVKSKIFGEEIHSIDLNEDYERR